MAYNDEARLQADIVAWVRRVAPQVRLTAVPLGVYVDKSAASLIRWTGGLAGWPDLVIAYPGGIALAEVKTRGGVLSDSQKELFPQLAEIGHPVTVVRSVEDMRDLLHRLGIEVTEAV